MVSSSQRPLLIPLVQCGMVMLIAMALTLASSARDEDEVDNAERQRLRGELEEALAEFVVTPEEQVHTRDLLQQLDADRYADRRQALATLLKAPSLPVDLIVSVRAQASPNQRVLIDHVLTLNDDSAAEMRLTRLMQRISEEGIRGLGESVLAAFKGRQASDRDTVIWGCRAMEATVVRDDLALVRQALQSKTALVRRVALAGIAELLGEAEIDLLLSMLDDDDDAVRFQIANLLAAHGHRECLAVFAGLLESDVFAYRIQSGDTLTLLTGQDFGYLADAIVEERQGPVDLWQRWVKKFGATADLDFEDFALQNNGDGFGFP